MLTTDRTMVTRFTRTIPAATVSRLRDDVLGSAAEMVREIQNQVPEYRQPAEPVRPDGSGAARQSQALRHGVELALRRYVDLLDQYAGQPGFAAAQGGNGDGGDWQGLYRAIGANELRQGRSLEALHAAVRICARVANRRLRAFAEHHALPPDLVAWLGEVIFDNIDDVSQAAAEGYAEAQRAQAGELDRRRRRLLDLLLAEPASSAGAVAAAAGEAQWHLPRQLAAVVIAAPAPIAQSPVLSPDVLAAFDRNPPCLIVPDPEGVAQVRKLVKGLAHHRAAVGLPVSPADAGKSLRWARLALDLATSGVIPQEPVIWCVDHLAALAVFQDQALVTALAERRLAPLAKLRHEKRELFAETLLAWLTLNMNANAVANRLHLHPQTVRQRLRQLTPLFGDQIRDPDQRFELEIALRTECARSQRRGKPAATHS